MRLSLVGLSHKTAAVEVREQCAAAGGGESEFYRRAREDGLCQEAVLLSTCNRMELYGVTPSSGAALEEGFCRLLHVAPPIRSCFYVCEDVAVVRHLFTVASGLDSLVLGETEITGQVKRAYETARAAGHTGQWTNRLFQMALNTAKLVRSRTGIGCGAVSVGSVAVELARRIFGENLARQSVLILGAGQMARLCAHHLVKHGVQTLRVANRSRDHAEALIAEVGGVALPWEQRAPAMAGSDIVVCAAAGDTPWLTRADLEAVMTARHQRPLVLIDVAVPRIVAPSVHQMENVYLYDMDDLESVVREHTHQREQELSRCQPIIERQVSAFLDAVNRPGANTGLKQRPPAWRDRRFSDPVTSVGLEGCPGS